MTFPVQIEELRPLRRVEYERMVEHGVFEDERLELLEGFIVCMPPQRAPHSSVVQRLTRLLVMTFPADEAAVRCQLPLALSEDSEPEPDFAIVPAASYDREHPTRCYLVIEVADSSIGRDRRKAALYARAGVPEYWLVDIANELVQVFDEPVDGTYSRVTPYHRGQSVAPRAFARASLTIDAIFRD